MKIIIGKNCTGKTRDLIKESLEHDIPIFSMYPGKAESLREKSMCYFNKMVRVVTPQDFDNGYKGPIMIDDIDKLFSLMLSDYVKSFDFTVVAASITED